ncbi:HPF/RaiA family ribosome-associated protein [Acanthopleuribacter pedis]|uniref:Uncharacterized protein n=1 Tax=Acanthopleuribacter pedis TaxID=442870 RepID=A0A8J7QGI9_9BACT|nr:hypothetical protein [Acanthopleuribacter pedis]MBO1318145.1 hypothetical protein [Acanthopleuribacter pedis]
MNTTKTNMTVVFRTHNYELGGRNRTRLEGEAGKLEDLVADFPVADLHVDIHEYPKGGFHVKTALRLPNDTLFTGDRHLDMHSAYLRCIRKLMLKVKTYKAKLSGEHRYHKTPEMGEVPVVTPDAASLERLDQAVEAGDYRAFREGLTPWEPELGAAVARYCENDTHAALMIGHGFNQSHLLEEVVLNAFEQYSERGRNKLDLWLQDLIDTSFGKLVADPKFERHRIEVMR